MLRHRDVILRRSKCNTRSRSEPQLYQLAGNGGDFSHRKVWQVNYQACLQIFIIGDVYGSFK